MRQDLEPEDNEPQWWRIAVVMVLAAAAGVILAYTVGLGR